MPPRRIGRGQIPPVRHIILSLLWLQAGTLLESRRQSRELAAQRELADKAEASRFTDLRQMLEGEFARLKGTNTSGQPGELLERLNRMEAALRQDIHDTGNGLAAHIGELEDRLGQAGDSPRA